MKYIFALLSIFLCYSFQVSAQIQQKDQDWDLLDGPVSRFLDNTTDEFCSGSIRCLSSSFKVYKDGGVTKAELVTIGFKDSQFYLNEKGIPSEYIREIKSVMSRQMGGTDPDDLDILDGPFAVAPSTTVKSPRQQQTAVIIGQDQETGEMIEVPAVKAKTSESSSKKTTITLGYKSHPMSNYTAYYMGLTKTSDGTWRANTPDFLPRLEVEPLPFILPTEDGDAIEVPGGG